MQKPLPSKYCKFGSKCKFDDTYDCENCDNLKYLIDKESDKVSERVVEKDKALAKMAQDISVLKREKVQLKENNNVLEQQLEVIKVENKKLVGEITNS